MPCERKRGRRCSIRPAGSSSPTHPDRASDRPAMVVVMPRSSVMSLSPLCIAPGRLVTSYAPTGLWSPEGRYRESVPQGLGGALVWGLVGFRERGVGRPVSTPKVRMQDLKRLSNLGDFGCFQRPRQSFCLLIFPIAPCLETWMLAMEHPHLEVPRVSQWL